MCIRDSFYTFGIVAAAYRCAVYRKHFKMLSDGGGGEPSHTVSGAFQYQMCIRDSIGGPQDIGAVLLNDAGGIGLFRSEFLYLESSDYPTEEEQFRAYRKVIESMAGKKVIIRTLDIGAEDVYKRQDLLSSRRTRRRPCREALCKARRGQRSFCIC